VGTEVDVDAELEVSFALELEEMPFITSSFDFSLGIVD